uniref:BTB domain-containing protein n=1 Tax=Caenorhabditis tropicalis TaxID=1561998 RepID=A0A1I7T8Z0_9PELO
MNDYPTWFVQEAPGSHGPAIVRLFEDGAQKFVLARELLDAMERAQMMSAELWKTEVMENMPELATFDFMELFKMLDKKDMQEIEFVRTPIRRTKHRVIFIPYHAGGYIIPAVDLLMELIHDTISVRKILQDVTEDKLSIICDILLNCFTTEEVKDLRFVKLTQVEKMKKDVLTQLQERVPDAFLKHKQEVYRVGLQGFTLKDLQNELERLGLVKTFPFIVEDYSEFVFEWTELEKKEEVLRTCDMHDALELCQRYALLSRHMELVDFLHYSGACSRLKMKCHRCRDAAAAKKEQTEKELEEKKGEGSNCQKEDDQVETLEKKLAAIDPNSETVAET